MASEPRLTLEGYRAVRRLQRALELGTGFALHVLVVESPAALRVVLEALRAGGGEELELMPAPDTSASGWTAAYLEDIQRSTVEGHQPLLLDMTAFEARDQTDWTLILHRLNFGRNGLVKALNRPLILAVNPRLEPLLAGEAPDLWSVRTLTIVAEVARRERHYHMVWPGRFPELPPAHYHPDQLQAQLHALSEHELKTPVAAALHTQLAEALLAHSRPEDALGHALAAVDLRIQQDGKPGDIASGLYSSAALVVEAADQTLQPTVGLHCVERALARLAEGDMSDLRMVSVQARLHSELVRPLLELERAPEALESARISVAQLRRLMQQLPDQTESSLIQALLLEGAASGALSNLEGARFVFREAASRAERAYATGSSQAGVLVQEALQQETFILSVLGRPAEAGESAARAGAIAAALRGESPHLRAVAATSFEAAAIALVNNGRTAQGVRKAVDAVHLWRGLAAECPLLGRQRLAIGLLLLAMGLFKADEHERAREALQEVGRSLREIAKDGPSAFTPMLAHGVISASGILLASSIRGDIVHVLRTLCDAMNALGERTPVTHLEPAIDASLELLRAVDPTLVGPGSEDGLAKISARLRAAPPETRARLRDKVLEVEISRAEIAASRGARDEALAICRSALSLVQDEPHLHADTRSWVAGLYDLSAKLLRDQHQLSESRSNWEASLKHLRQAYGQNPARYARPLSSVLRFAAESERALKHKNAARPLAAEALQALWPAFEEDPASLREEVGALLHLSRRLSRSEPSRDLAERIRLFEEICGALPSPEGE